MASIAKAVRIDQARPAPMHWEAVFHELGHSTWKGVGNPLAWPASIPFAVERGTHPRAWDVVGSQELFYHDHQTLERRGPESTLELGYAWAEGYVAGSFQRDVVRLEGRDVRVAAPGRARIFLPLHWPDAGAITLDVVPAVTDQRSRVRAALNGVTLGVETVPGARTTLRFAVPAGVSFHGINELTLDLGRPLGVGTVQVFDRDPLPTLEQRRRNAELLEQRRRATGRSEE
ncbi:MAG: hypothetical protein R3B99_25020 [Polyangiales bacterium]